MTTYYFIITLNKNIALIKILMILLVQKDVSPTGGNILFFLFAMANFWVIWALRSHTVFLRCVVRYWLGVPSTNHSSAWISMVAHSQDWLAKLRFWVFCPLSEGGKMATSLTGCKQSQMKGPPLVLNILTAQVASSQCDTGCGTLTVILCLPRCTTRGNLLTGPGRSAKAS